MSSQSPYQAPEGLQWQNQTQTDTSSNEPSYPHELSLDTGASTQDSQSRNEAALVQGPTIAPPVARKRPLLRVLAHSAFLRWGSILVGILLAIGGILLISNVALPPGPYRSDQGKVLFSVTLTPQGSDTPAYYILGLGDEQHNYLVTPEHNYWINPADFNASALTPDDFRQASSATVIYRPDKDNTFMYQIGQLTPVHEAVQITLSEGNVQKVYTSTEYNGYIQTRQRDIQTRQTTGVALLIPGLLIALLAFVAQIIRGRTTRKQTIINIAPEVSTEAAMSVEKEPQPAGYPSTVAVAQRENGFQQNPEPASPGSPMIPKEWMMLHTLTGHTDGVLCVAISPDGQTLVSGSEDRAIKLWNLQTGELLRTLTGHTDGVLCVAISPDGHLFASGSGDETIKLWNLQTGELLRTLAGHTDAVFSIAISPDGQMLFSGSGDETIKLWNLQTGELLRTLAGHTDAVFSVAISPDGQMLASGGADQTIKLWNWQTGELLRTFAGHSNFVLSVAISPDGQTLASGSTDKTIRLWKLSTGELLHTLEGHSNFVLSVAISPDGRMLASGSEDKTIKLWSLQTGELLHTLEGHSNFVLSVAISPDGQVLASGSEDKTIKLWGMSQPVLQSAGYAGTVAVAQGRNGLQRKPEPGSPAFPSKPEAWTLLHTLAGHADWVLCVAISPDGQTLASSSKDKTIKLWNLQTGELLRTLEGHADEVFAVAINPNGQTLASGSNDKTIRLWNWQTGELLHTLEGHAGGVGAVAISPDGQTLASGSADRTIKLWKPSTGELLRTLTGHVGAITCVAISPDGQTLASGGIDHTIKLWNLQTGELSHTLTGHAGDVFAVAISPDGQIVASGGADQTIKLWNLQTGELLHSLTEHTGDVFSVAISPDGQTLASGSADQTIKLWNLQSGKLLHTLTGHTGDVFSVAISPDGQMLASGGVDHMIKIWRMYPPTAAFMREVRGGTVVAAGQGSSPEYTAYGVQSSYVPPARTQYGSAAQQEYTSSLLQQSSTPAPPSYQPYTPSTPSTPSPPPRPYVQSGTPGAIPAYGAPPPQPPYRPPSQQKKPSRWLIIMLIAVAAFVALGSVGVGVFLLLQPQAPTPSPNGAPPDSMSFTITITVQRQDAVTGKQLDPWHETLIITGHPDSGNVCKSRDSGQSYTGVNVFGDSSIYAETFVFKCSGTYKGGKLTYIETVASMQFTISGGSTCGSNSPFEWEHLEGTFSNQNTISGTFSSEAHSVPCSSGSSLSANAQTGTWTGTLE